MGVRGLGAVINQFAPDAISQCVIAQLSNRALAVDTPHMIYKYSISIRNSGKDIINRSGKNVNHLQALFNTIYSCIKHNILPVFISDGKAGDFKRSTIDDRKARQENAVKIFTEMDEDINEMTNEMTIEKIKYFKRAFMIEQHMYRECKYLCDITGVPYIVAPTEADPQCAALARSEDSDVWGVISDDWDMLLFGTPFLIRGFTTRKDKKIDIVSLDIILNRMNLTHSEFIDVCILLGTDYNEIEHNGVNRVFKIKGLTNKKAYTKYVQYNKNIENLVSGLIAENKMSVNAGKQPEFNIPIDFIDGFNKIKAYINDMKVSIPNQIDTTWKNPNIETAEKFMCVENNFSTKIIGQQLDIILAKYEDEYLGSNKGNNVRKQQRYRQRQKHSHKYYSYSGAVTKQHHSYKKFD